MPFLIERERLARVMHAASCPIGPVQPTVSVAMATFNGRRYVLEQLRSILDQLDADDEVVVVDDASNDATADAIAAVADARVRLLRQSRNAGVRASFDRALRACRGRFLFLSDQDDRWLPGKREAMVEALEGGALLVVSDARIIDADGRLIAESFMARRHGFRGGVVSTLIRNRYLGCAMAFRRELLADVLPIPATVPQHDMWIGILAAARGTVVYLPTPLIEYRRHDGNLSSLRRASWARMLVWRWRLLTLLIGRRLRGPLPVAVEPVS